MENRGVNILNEYMTNLKVFQNNLYNMHFNIVGASFFGLHRKLQEYYEKIALFYDEIAERIKMLDGYPITSLKKIEDVSTIKSMKSMNYSGNQVLEVLENDYYFLKDYARDLISIFQKEEDYYTAGILNSHLCFYEKELWMVQSSLKNKIN